MKIENDTLEQKLEQAYQLLHTEQQPPVTPDERWRQSVMRKVRNMPATQPAGQGLHHRLQPLLMPVAQVMALVGILATVYIMNSNTLATLDLAIFYSEQITHGNDLISYYSFRGDQ